MISERLKGRSLLTWLDFTSDEVQLFLNMSKQIKGEKQRGEIHRRFTGKTLALLFEKLSTRTRCSFETAFGEEGGYPVFLGKDDIHLGVKESLEDTARVLGRMFTAIEFRGYKQSTAETLAKFSGVPVYNGLTDDFHPTQALADMLTIDENFGGVHGRKLCFVGDGRNNTVRSLMVIGAKLGLNLFVITPKSLYPNPAFLDECSELAKNTGGSITVSSEISAVKNADAIYTDVWASMGEESKREERIKLLKPYQVNQALMDKSGRKDTIFMHDLPAIKGEEVTANVIDGPQSKAWDQAENRKHTIKAIMLATINGTSD
ncbi:MAG: ornithine carbamoyltransferase [Treponema sp.]|nr:ornithine carbamoyltransferase [Treponema sp.]